MPLVKLQEQGASGGEMAATIRKFLAGMPPAETELESIAREIQRAEVSRGLTFPAGALEERELQPPPVRQRSR